MRVGRLVLGLVLVAAGAYLALSPEKIVDWFGATPKTTSDVINLRASYGGTLAGIGAFIAWLPALRPWPRAVLGLLGWAMLGILAARLVGFATDGNPDSRQFIWVIAEVVLVVGSAFGIRWLEKRRS
jgi:hypothetical protein